MPRFRLPGPLGSEEFRCISNTAKSASSSKSIIRWTLQNGTIDRTQFGRTMTPVTSTGTHVTVYIWVSLLKLTSPGHAAIAIRPGAKTPGEGYISFAPRESGRISGPGHFYSWDEDVVHYGDIQKAAGKGRGMWMAKIFGLDLAAMLPLLERDLLKPPDYSIANQCATMTHRYLQIGGGDRYASRWSSNVLGFWSPDDVEDYTRSIADNTSDLGSSYEKYSGDGTLF